MEERHSGIKIAPTFWLTLAALGGMLLRVVSGAEGMQPTTKQKSKQSLGANSSGLAEFAKIFYMPIYRRWLGIISFCRSSIQFITTFFRVAGWLLATEWCRFNEMIGLSLLCINLGFTYYSDRNLLRKIARWTQDVMLWLLTVLLLPMQAFSVRYKVNVFSWILQGSEYSCFSDLDLKYKILTLWDLINHSIAALCFSASLIVPVGILLPLMLCHIISPFAFLSLGASSALAIAASLAVVTAVLFTVGAVFMLSGYDGFNFILDALHNKKVKITLYFLPIIVFAAFLLCLPWGFGFIALGAVAGMSAGLFILACGVLALPLYTVAFMFCERICAKLTFALFATAYLVKLHAVTPEEADESSNEAPSSWLADKGQSPLSPVLSHGLYAILVGEVPAVGFTSLGTCLDELEADVETWDDQGYMTSSYPSWFWQPNVGAHIKHQWSSAKEEAECSHPNLTAAAAVARSFVAQGVTLSC